MHQKPPTSTASSYILVSVWMIPIMISTVGAYTTGDPLFCLGTIAGPTASGVLFLSRKIKQFCTMPPKEHASSANDATEEIPLEGSTRYLLKQLGYQLTELSKNKAQMDIEYYPLKRMIKSGDTVEKKVTKKYIELKTGRREIKNKKTELTNTIADLNGLEHKAFNVV